MDARYFQPQLCALVNFLHFVHPEDMSPKSMSAKEVSEALPPHGFCVEKRVSRSMWNKWNKNKGVIRSTWNKWSKDKGSVQLNLSTCGFWSSYLQGCALFPGEMSEISFLSPESMKWTC